MVTLSTLAQSVPPLINYQGRLADSNGAPLLTADYALEVSIYTNAVSGAAVWGPQLFDGQPGLAGHGAKVPVVQGYFNVILGPCDTATNSILNGFVSAETYVAVFTNGTPISPRQRILSTPYAINGVPAGTVNAFAGPTNNVPHGWLLCDGRAISRSHYAVLFSAIGTYWGIGDALATFNLPDLRGQFLRGADPSGVIDTNVVTRTPKGTGPVGEAGSIQVDATRKPNNVFQIGPSGSHQHFLKNRVSWRRTLNGDSYFVPMSAEGADGSPWPNWYAGTGSSDHSHTVDGGGDAETRPKNAAVNFIIKY